jgi:hypothetical protein
MPPQVARQAGEERSVVPGDVVLTAPLGWLSAAILSQPVEVEIAGARESFGAGAMLLHALEARGGDLAQLPAAVRTYCGEERLSSARVAASALALGVSDLATRLRRNTRFCLVDSDKDDRFDRAFLVGTRRDEDRRMVTIAPTPLEIRINHPLGEGDRLEVMYGEAGLLNNPHMRLHLYRAASAGNSGSC